MATLTNPISPQNIVDRFADYVVATANAGIIYHSTNKPFPEFDGALLGAASGLTIGISGASIVPANNIITAPNIYNTLLAETNRYTRIRNLNATLTITEGPGNKSREFTDARNVTAVAHLTADYAVGAGSPANGGVASGLVAFASSFESLFTNLRSGYNTARANTAVINVNVCHGSCHASCHGSRGRR